MFCVELRRLGDHLTRRFNEPKLADRCLKLSKQLKQAIETHGIIQHPVHGRIFAYEVDGFGNANCMDDANMPSLLGLPLLKFIDSTDPIYQNTRNFVLSESNPYWFKGSVLMGVGGPHIGLGYVWPMAIVTEVRLFYSQIGETNLLLKLPF